MAVKKVTVNQLARQAQQAKIAGDKQTANQAFEQIHAEIDRYLFCAVASLYRKDKEIKSFIDIEDIVAEAYLIAWEKLETFRPEGDFTAWVRRIAVNQCCYTLRKKQRKQGAYKNISLDNEEYAPQIVGGNVVEEVESRLRSADIVHILKSLPEPQYLVFDLRYLEEMSTRTIAERLNEPESTITSRLAYARKKIERALDKEKANGNELYGAMVMNGALLRSIMESAAPEMPADFSAHVSARVMQGISAAQTTAGATAATTTAAGTSAASTATTGVGIVGKFAALTAGTKAAAIAAAVVVIGGSGAGVYVHQQNAARQAEAAALVQQQEEQARLDAEQAAQEAAEKAAAEEAARQAEAEKIAAEQAAQKLAAEQAEAERAAEQAAEEEAEEAARAAAAEQAAQEQAAPQGAAEGTSSGPSTSGPGSNHEDDGLPSFGPVGGSSSAAPNNGMNDRLAYVGKEEPTGTRGNVIAARRPEAEWDSSEGGWVYMSGGKKSVIYPNGSKHLFG